METKNIELENYRGISSSVFTGRPQGEDARLDLNLAKLDSSKLKINFIIPSDTTAITPSFFLGLLYDSIKKLGIQNYREKYSFIFQDQNLEILKILKENIEEGERHAINSMSQKRGISRFIK